MKSQLSPVSNYIVIMSNNLHIVGPCIMLSKHVHVTCRYNNV